jgi:hypothetical protein
VPNVVGQPVAAAEKALTDEGFEVRKAYENSDQPVDQVIRQDPGAGEEAEEGSTVTITLSQGVEQVEVPDVTGKTVVLASEQGFGDTIQFVRYLPLLAERGAAALRREISLEHAAAYPMNFAAAPDSSHTTHITVMDAKGNMVLMTQTLMEFFGCRAVIPGTGAFMNNTMALFDPHPGRPNSVAPGKRMLTYTSSTIVLKNGSPWFALGTPGGGVASLRGPPLGHRTKKSGITS